MAAADLISFRGSPNLDILEIECSLDSIESLLEVGTESDLGLEVFRENEAHNQTH